MEGSWLRGWAQREEFLLDDVVPMLVESCAVPEHRRIVGVLHIGKGPVASVTCCESTSSTSYPRSERRLARSSLDWDSQERCGLCSPGRFGEPGEEEHLNPLKDPLARQVRVVHVEPPAAMLDGNIRSVGRISARMDFQDRLYGSHCP